RGGAGGPWSHHDDDGRAVGAVTHPDRSLAQVVDVVGRVGVDGVEPVGAVGHRGGVPVGLVVAPARSPVEAAGRHAAAGPPPRGVPLPAGAADVDVPRLAAGRVDHHPAERGGAADGLAVHVAGVDVVGGGGHRDGVVDVVEGEAAGGVVVAVVPGEQV